MKVPAPWTENDFADLLSSPGIFLTTQHATQSVVQSPSGFALGRVVLDEAELLTLAVAPEFQGRGNGRECLRAFEAEAAARGARRAFLEVADTNQVARGFYLAEGWTEDAKRPKYYRTANGRTDAIMMSKTLKSP